MKSPISWYFGVTIMSPPIEIIPFKPFSITIEFLLCPKFNISSYLGDIISLPEVFNIPFLLLIIQIVVP